MYHQENPFEGGWAFLRGTQTDVLNQNIDKTGMIVTTDLGAADDAHPRNKLDVGNRLGNLALAKTYGKDVIYSGPMVKSCSFEKDKVIVEWDFCLDKLSTSDGEKVRGFALKGRKGWVWADAKIQGNKVILSSKFVKKPKEVAYNWANNPVGNLVNSAKLPANSLYIKK